MYPKGPSTVLFLTALVLLVGFLAGCGGEGQSGNGSQDGGSGGVKKQGGGKDAKQRASETKIALGGIAKVDTEAGKIVLRPSADVQSEKPLRFKITGNATIRHNGEKAELADVKKGQDAQITYVVKKGRNVARQVALFSGG